MRSGDLVAHRLRKGLFRAHRGLDAFMRPSGTSSPADWRKEPIFASRPWSNSLGSAGHRSAMRWNTDCLPVTRNCRQLPFGVRIHEANPYVSVVEVSIDIDAAERHAGDGDGSAQCDPDRHR